VPAQRARPAVPADLRSAHPNIPGIPWWGAVLIGVVACAIGFAYDAGSGAGQLTSVFSVLYVMGCLTAVLAVRRTGVFTAVIQPPLLLFVVVPGAYFLMHISDIHGIKDVLINCGYPLIERFPLMFFTSATVLLIGVARWYFGARRSAAPTNEKPAAERLAAKLSSLVGPRPAAGARDEEPRRRHSAARRPTTAARSGRPTKRAGTPSRSRHNRPPETELIVPVVDLDRPRRRRPRPADEPPVPPAERRRRARPSPARDPRPPIPQNERRAYNRSERDRPQRSERPRPQRRSPYEDYDGYEPLEPHGPVPNSSHIPVSRVRYRGSDQAEDLPDYRPRRRAPRDVDADRWEYDI
jgi:hypothetical protein